MDEKISLNAWADQEIELIAEFVSDWRENNSACPDYWDMEQEPGVWEEQYRTWHDAACKEDPVVDSK